MSELKYNLNDFEEIKHNGFDYELPEKTLHMINKIARLVGSPDYIKTPIFKRRYNHTNSNQRKQLYHNRQHNYHKHNKKRKQPRELNDEEWEMLRKFEKTKLQKRQDGINKELNKLRILLNKLTEQTFETIKEEFFEKVDEIIEDFKENDLYKLVETIFEIASSNQFYSSTYASFIKLFIEKYDIFYSVFEKKYIESVETLMNTFENNHSDQQEKNNYNDLCEFNIENDKRKATSKFLANLVKEDVIDASDYIEHLNDIINILCHTIKQPNKEQTCENISDVLYEILISCSKTLYESYEDDTVELFEKIGEITESKPNSKYYPSLSNKCLFKLMDIMDYLEENEIYENE